MPPKLETVFGEQWLARYYWRHLERIELRNWSELEITYAKPRVAVRSAPPAANRLLL